MQWQRKSMNHGFNLQQFSGNNLSHYEDEEQLPDHIIQSGYQTILLKLQSYYQTTLSRAAAKPYYYNPQAATRKPC